MPRLTPCPTCHSHVLVDERECPHCGASLRSGNARVPAVLMGLALTGCPSIGEPEYGVPDTTAAPTSTDGESGTDSGTDSVGEPEYGVPDTGIETGTDTVGEPEYGVPDTGA